MSQGIWTKIAQLDRRVLYWILFLLLIIPPLKPLGLPLTVSPSTRGFYDFIDTLGSEDICVFSISGGVSAWPEILPGMIATVRHYVRQDVDFVVWGTFLDMSMSWEEIKKNIPEINDLEYGVDYVYVGYLAGGETVIKQLAEDTHVAVKADGYGTPISELPLMDRIKSWEDISLVVSTDTGDAGLYYVRHWNAPHGVPVGINGIAMFGSEWMPLYISRQLMGLLVGVRGAGEYEYLLKAFGPATRGLDALNVSHLLVIAAVIMANIGMIMSRREGK